MSQISHIKYKDTIEAWRIDADFFKPDFLSKKNILEKKDNIHFGDIIETITDWKHWWVTFVDKWVLFIRNINIVNWMISINEPMYISEEESSESKRAELKPWNLLLTTIGKIWEAAVVPQEIKRANINQNLVKIQIDKNYSPYYISIFLNSIYWKSQTQRYAAWNIQPLLNYDNIKNLKISNLSYNFQQKIEDIALLSHSKQEESKQLYHEAEDLLLTELWLKNHTISHTLTFSTTKKAVDEAWRYDADYFQPKYDELIEKIENYKWGWDNVENLFKYKKWFEPWAEAYTQEWMDFIRVSDFTKFWIDWVEKKISEKMYDELKENYQAKKWEILFTKDWTIWITYVLKEDLQWIISSAFLRLNLKEKYENYEKECLALILNSIICKLQIERFSWWALISHLKPSDFERIKIPLINLQLQKEISDKIKVSFKLRNESKELLEQAKKMVEDEIEK